MRSGYLGWPAAVGRDRVDRALKVIHQNLGAHGLHPDRLLEYEHQSYCPELRAHPDILALFNGTRLEAEAVRRLGPLMPVNRAQIALRFPTAKPITPFPHLDGMSTPNNTVQKGEIRTFSALACIYLSEVPADGGALTVWPGTHLDHAKYFADHGPESLLNGMPPIPLPEPHPLVGGPGHGFLVHYLVGHSVGPHSGSGIRYAVFFRLRATDHSSRGFETMVDPWLEWSLE